MNLYNDFRAIIVGVVEQMMQDGDLPAGLDTSRVTAEPPREAQHGDIATNVAMVLAKPAGQNPRKLAETLAEILFNHPDITNAEVAGPGFINLSITPSLWAEGLRAALRLGIAYGDSTVGQDSGGKGLPVNVEYVSANPTGPLHVGHGRGAIVGDALASLLAKAGFAVTREYYINDAGAQVDVLGRALYARYRVALGDLSPEGFAEMLAAKEIQYGGDYLIPAAEALVARDGSRWLGLDESQWLAPVRDFGIDAMMALVRDDLRAVGVHHDVFTSERGLVAAGKVTAVKASLEARDLIYIGTLEPPKGKLPDDWEARPQTLFRATQFGDEVDRPLVKSDGSWTYFANDIAYHLDKVERGFNAMIDIWGADHGGYVKRMQAAVKAVSNNQADLDVKLCQLVKLLDKGEPVKMSKRAGTFITLREVIEHPGIGRDVFRFIMLSRKNDAPLEFDYAKVTEQSRDNPVWYVQYAHARAMSVMRHAVDLFPEHDLTPDGLATADVSLLIDSAELDILKLIAGWPRLIEGAAEAHEPHRVAYYLNDVASAFHGLWNKGREHAELRFLEADHPQQSLARLALVYGMATIIASGLAIFGVTPLEEMH